MGVKTASTWLARGRDGGRLWFAAGWIGLAAAAIGGSTAVVHTTPTKAQDVIAQAERYAKAHPNEPDAAYMAGRVNYAVFALRAEMLDAPAVDGNDAQGLPKLPMLQNHVGRLNEGGPLKGVPVGPATMPADDKAAGAHLKSALDWLRKATDQNQDRGEYQLGLACAMEDAAGLAGRLEDPHKEQLAKDPRPLGEQWLDLAMDRYRRAFDLTAENDLKRTWLPNNGLHSVVAYEAAVNYLRMADKWGIGLEDKAEIDKMRKSIPFFEGLKPPPVW